METKDQILWEEISTGPSDRIVWDAPKIVQGEYLGAETQPHRAGFSDNRCYHRIEVDGEEKGFFGTTILDRGLKNVEAGDLVRIEYLGEKRLGGGKTIKQFVIKRQMAVKKSQK